MINLERKIGKIFGSLVLAISLSGCYITGSDILGAGLGIGADYVPNPLGSRVVRKTGDLATLNAQRGHEIKRAEAGTTNINIEYPTQNSIKNDYPIVTTSPVADLEDEQVKAKYLSNDPEIKKRADFLRRAAEYWENAGNEEKASYFKERASALEETTTNQDITSIDTTVNKLSSSLNDLNYNPIFDPNLKIDVSHDRKKIVFSKVLGKTMDIFIADINGKNLSRLTFTSDENEISPCWSPDDKKIAYYSLNWGVGEVVRVMNADGGLDKVVGVISTLTDNIELRNPVALKYPHLIKLSWIDKDNLKLINKLSPQKETIIKLEE